MFKPHLYMLAFSLTLCTLLWVTVPGGAASQSLPAGAIIERVVCQKDATQSYALYLPSTYPSDRRWPMIYAFDPGARGAVPVKLYREAAEKYGYIIAGSNNSRNGPNVPLGEIIQALWEDTHTRLVLDDRRIYTTGFSGGARVASSVASINPGRVAGVILQGAGFHPRLNVTKELSFIVYGLVGSEDFNYFELKQLDRALAEAGVPHRLKIFEGAHSWAAADDCTSAVGWMELHAIKTGLRAKDQTLLDTFFVEALSHARTWQGANRPGGAFAAYETLAADFRGLRDVNEFEQKSAAIKASPAFKDELKREKSEEQSYNLRFRDFARLREQMKKLEEHDNALADARRIIAALKKQADGNSGFERREARRLLSLYSVSLREEANQQRYNKNYRDLLDSLVLANEVRPDQPQTLYQLAAAHALNNNKKQSFDALKRAIEKGWQDAAEIEQNPAFDSIRRDTMYRQLLETIQTKPKQKVIQ